MSEGPTISTWSDRTPLGPRPPSAFWPLTARWTLAIGVFALSIFLTLKTPGALGPLVFLPAMCLFVSAAYAQWRFANAPRPISEEDKALLDDAPGPWLVEVEIVQSGYVTGQDRGAMWMEGDRLVFNGHRSSFALGSDDLIPNTLRTLDGQFFQRRLRWQTWIVDLTYPKRPVQIVFTPLMLNSGLDKNLFFFRRRAPWAGWSYFLDQIRDLDRVPPALSTQFPPLAIDPKLRRIPDILAMAPSAIFVLFFIPVLVVGIHDSNWFAWLLFLGALCIFGDGYTHVSGRRRLLAKLRAEQTSRTMTTDEGDHDVGKTG